MDATNADEQFQAELRSIFAQLPLIPEDVITDVHSFGYAEDNKTLVVMLDTAGGKTLMIQATPNFFNA